MSTLESTARNWSVYLIYNPNLNRTYIGATTDVTRRLRQHRQEIVGGARSTSKDPDWRLVGYLSGFPSQSEAYRWEKILKSRCRGYKQRVMGLALIASGKCPENPKKPKLPVYSMGYKISLYFLQDVADNNNVAGDSASELT
jgi:predicted GIY-YIG superfamily endonuclease